MAGEGCPGRILSSLVAMWAGLIRWRTTKRYGEPQRIGVAVEVDL